MARVCVRSITRSTMYQKAPFCASWNWRMKNSSVARGFSSIKIDHYDYPKSLISRINKVYIFSIKYRFCDTLLKKSINFIQVVCFAAITLVIALTWFL